jgi:hypothetical protein
MTAMNGLSIDLVVPEDRLFVLDLEGLKKLEMDMFRQGQVDAEAMAIRAQGPYYLMMWQQQYKLTVELQKFLKSQLDYSPLAHGNRIHDWLKAHNEPITTASLKSAWAAIRAMDEMAPAEPPRITSQPADAAVLAGAPASFSVEVIGTAPFQFEWFKDGQAILGATRSTYITPATEFNNGSRFSVTVRNAVAEVSSPPVTLRIVPK